MIIHCVKIKITYENERKRENVKKLKKLQQINEQINK